MQTQKGMTMELGDKTIMVTGASSGRGAAAALLFASEGANVVLGARRESQLNAIAGQITQSNGSAVCLAGDVTEETYCKDLVELAEQHFGGVGKLVATGIIEFVGHLPSLASERTPEILRLCDLCNKVPSSLSA
ncbi:SDR family NAD(P)-dependent oxidoreductase [Ruegeria hyattellae]|uniref:SDR family NAD(P)-dependent oxidoreductase n=1 Tax=Ruegeria hyattellae TaxID=3233337 RepID=UPI00355C2DD7